MDEKEHIKQTLTGTRNIKETVPEEDRPREKAKKHGFGALSTAELLAILLRVGTPGESVVDLCQRILRDNDDKLYLIARKGINNLVKNYHGIGEVKAIEILAALMQTRSLKIACLAVASSFTQLCSYGWGFIKAYVWKVLLKHGRDVEEEVMMRKGK